MLVPHFDLLLGNVRLMDVMQAYLQTENARWYRQSILTNHFVPIQYVPSERGTGEEGDSLRRAEEEPKEGR